MYDIQLGKGGVNFVYSTNCFVCMNLFNVFLSHIHTLNPKVTADSVF